MFQVQLCDELTVAKNTPSGGRSTATTISMISANVPCSHRSKCEGPLHSRNGRASIALESFRASLSAAWRVRTHSKTLNRPTALIVCGAMLEATCCVSSDVSSTTLLRLMVEVNSPKSLNSSAHFVFGRCLAPHRQTKLGAVETLPSSTDITHHDCWLQ